MFDASPAAAARAVKNGGVVAYPTEAVFGIGCLPEDVRALSRVMEIKKRDPAKGVIVIGGSFAEVAPFLDLALIPEELLTMMRDFWPGPVTCVLPAREGLPDLLTGGRSTLAVRVSAHPPVADLCRLSGSALVSTSCNVSGKPPLRTAREVRDCFPPDTFDCILDLPCGSSLRPSRIIDGLTGRVLRE